MKTLFETILWILSIVAVLGLLFCIHMLFHGIIKTYLGGM
jgi:hypothetical protein